MDPVTHNHRPNSSPINKLDKAAAQFICFCGSSVLSLCPPLIFSLFSLSCFPFPSLQTLCLHSCCSSYLFPNSRSLTSINPLMFSFLLSSLHHHFLLTCSDRSKQSSQYSHACSLITSFRCSHSQYTINITNKRNEYQLIFALGCMFHSQLTHMLCSAHRPWQKCYSTEVITV